MKTLSNLCIVFSLIFIAVLCQAQQTANLPSPTPYTANQTIADSTWGVANGTTTWIMNNVQGIDSLGRGLINDVSPSLQVSPNNQALDVPQDYLNTLAPEFGIDPNGPPARLFTDTIPVSLTAATFLTPGGEEEGGLMLWEGVANATEGTANKTIGLGLVSDLANHRGTGAITYANAGWQKAGLTSVD